jgi:hypothetical protein
MKKKLQKARVFMKTITTKIEKSPLSKLQVLLKIKQFWATKSAENAGNNLAKFVKKRNANSQISEEIREGIQENYRRKTGGDCAVFFTYSATTFTLNDPCTPCCKRTATV